MGGREGEGEREGGRAVYTLSDTLQDQQPAASHLLDSCTPSVAERESPGSVTLPMDLGTHLGSWSGEV